jgi:hypothetical protein
MPRKRPGQLRKLVDPRPVMGRLPTKVPYLSESSLRRLARAERALGWPAGWCARLLSAWSRVTREPGYPLFLPLPVCSCPDCDPLGARRDLARLLEQMARPDRAILRVPLARIDRWYAARTLPDPHSTSAYWFERRMREQEGWGRLNGYL